MTSMLARSSRSYAGGHAHSEHETHLALTYINEIMWQIQHDLVTLKDIKSQVVLHEFMMKIDKKPQYCHLLMLKLFVCCCLFLLNSVNTKITSLYWSVS